MSTIALNLPTWLIIRLAGLASYAMLFIGVAFGIIYSMPFLKGIPKASFYKWHSFAANVGLLLAVGHVLFLVVDTYRPFLWKEIFVPFSGLKDTVWTGFGTIALYGMVLIIMTTDFKVLLHSKVWRLIHLMAYPVFFLSMLHGLGMGTDTTNPYVYGFYVFSFVVIIGLTVVRGIAAKKKGKLSERLTKRN